MSTRADPERIKLAITAVKAGDRSALHYLYVRYADQVCTHLGNIVGGRGAAEDLTQTVFLKLPGAIATYDSGELPFDRWLLRLANDSAVDHVVVAGGDPEAEQNQPKLRVVSGD